MEVRDVGSTVAAEQADVPVRRGRGRSGRMLLSLGLLEGPRTREVAGQRSLVALLQVGEELSAPAGVVVYEAVTWGA